MPDFTRSTLPPSSIRVVPQCPEVRPSSSGPSLPDGSQASATLSPNRQDISLTAQGPVFAERNFVCAAVIFTDGVTDAAGGGRGFFAGYGDWAAAIHNEFKPRPPLELATAQTYTARTLRGRYGSAAGFDVSCKRLDSYTLSCSFRRHSGSGTDYGHVLVFVTRDLVSGRVEIGTNLFAYKTTPAARPHHSPSGDGLPAWVNAANSQLAGIARNLADQAIGGQVSDEICPNQPADGRYTCGVSAQFPSYACSETVVFVQTDVTEATPEVSQPQCS